MKNAVSALQVLLSACILHVSLFARVLDNFDDPDRSGWEDFNFPIGVSYSQVLEANGQLTFTLQPIGQPIFSATKKLSPEITVENGKTVEFRVDLVNGLGKDSFAVLAFIPKANSLGTLAGYGFAKSTTDILVTKGINKYFHNQNPPVPLKNENVILSLSLTGEDGNVIITARLLDKDNANAVLFEKTYVDTPAADVLVNGTDDPPAPYLGVGNFALYCYEDYDRNAPQEVYQVTYDNAEIFVLENSVLDNFDDNTKTDWSDFNFPVGITYSSITEENGQFHFRLQPVGQAIFSASSKTSRTFDLVDGERLQFSVDLVRGLGKDSFAVLAFIPTANSPGTLAGYGLAKSTTDILITKGINKYFYNENPAEPIKNENVTLQLSLTARNGTVEINGKVIDKDSGAVLFDRTFLDTPAGDILRNGTDDPPAPYLGSGRFVLYCYEDFDRNAPQELYEVVYDNARVSAPPLAANVAPSISDLLPAPFANFLPPNTTITFKVTDDKPIVEDGVSVVVNGQTFTKANGLVFSGTGNTRNVSLAGLEANTDYLVEVNVTDAENASATARLYFDTFASTNPVIEVEDFNFSSGFFINDPVPLPEGWGPQGDAYVNQTGTPGIDYSDTRTDFRNAPYRPFDHVRMQRSVDLARQKFLDAGGQAAGVYDYEVLDIAAGEWLNYTRVLPPGSYEVYLREALVNGTQVESVLEEVTSDPALPDQTTRVLGSFITRTTGFQLKNVPLTDALGNNKVVLQVNGQKTFRLRQITGQPGDGAIYQNYLVFVPAQAQGTQRATITSLNPANGTTTETFAPVISATIQNRETSVKVSSIKLFVNDIPVTAQIEANAEGALVTYALPALPPAGSTVHARLEFEDSDNFSQSIHWSFTITYKQLNPAHRRMGVPGERGFAMRLVQALAGAPLENSITRAEDQLAPNSSIPKFVDTNITTQIINYNKFEGSAAGQFPDDLGVPGLDPEANGTADFAVEFKAFLLLEAGVHRFRIITDDGYKLTFGSSLDDRSSNPIAFRSGGTADHTVEFLVSEPGLYPLRMVWYERAGSAHAELISVNRTTGEQILINDPNASAGVKAFLNFEAPALVVESSASVDAGYAEDASAVVDTSNRQVTVTLSGGPRFFRIRAEAAHRITNLRRNGNSVLFNYE